MSYFTAKNRAINQNILALFLLLISCQGYAQKYTFKDMHAEDNVDSLEKWLVVNPTINEVRLKNLVKAEMSYLWKASNESFRHLQEIEFVSKKLNHRLGITFGKFQRGLYLNSLSKNDEALTYLSEAFRESEILNDLSAQVSILCYQSLISLNFSVIEKKELAKYYLSKAQKLIAKTQDPHDNILYLVTTLSNEQIALQTKGNSVYLYKLVSDILKTFNSNPELSYAFNWVKFMEGRFFTTINNHKKSVEINNKILRKTPENNYFMLSKIHFQLGFNYLNMNQFDLANKEFNLAKVAFRKIPDNFYFPAFTETKYFRLIEILNCQRQLALRLNDTKMGNTLVDSIFYYQRLDAEESSRKALLQIQYRYNYEKFEIEAQNLANEKKLATLNQRELQHDLKIKERDIEVLKYKNDLKLSQDKLKVSKLNNEKRIATAKSEAMFEQNKTLTLYIVFGTLLLALTFILLFILRRQFINEKRRNSFRNQFYTILTHDLRGSINSLNDIGKVLGYLIKNNRLNDLNKVANQIEWISCHTAILLDNTIDWGTSNSFEMDLAPQQVDISLLVNELILLYKAAIETKNITISIEIQDDVQLYTSSKSIIIIIRNMIDNAKTNTPANGKIGIEVKKLQVNNQVVIRVTNSGDLIPAQKVNFIQEVFDEKQKPEVGVNGLGLGIILMSQFAKKNNSSLFVTSDNTQGTIFNLLINPYRK
ncbi:histidine kinase/DNA gyrase B/HSP90-like ATPase [Arcicella aurantiaca]|uniref:histidine kinase n=1 Tax=Arcicella aurantiaca TaxID=591202 RepID=A0A316DJY7_9BACT|nr:ATP-binding protein [Arcicella aurantiaca]PWK17589.1 histidine kinase/DNA gyrase B/HSP90-like ATPase [Arcicella aurantiaca]